MSLGEGIEAFDSLKKLDEYLSIYALKQKKIKTLAHSDWGCCTQNIEFQSNHTLSHFGLGTIQVLRHLFLTFLGPPIQLFEDYSTVNHQE